MRRIRVEGGGGLAGPLLELRHGRGLGFAGEFASQFAGLRPVSKPNNP